MMRSMYSGVSGLKAHQTRMDVIGNNIANVNTNGYKKSRVVFADTLYQNMRYGTAPADTRGGTNPMGIGLGSKVASVDQIMTSAPTTTTNKTTDMAVDGNGYFIVKNGNESYYTRTGAFDWDKTYNLVNSNGYMVQGWMADPEQTTTTGDFVINTSGATTGINLQDFKAIEPRATENANFSGNLDASFDIPQITVAGVTGDISPVVTTGNLTSAAGAATTLAGALIHNFNIQVDGDPTAHNIILANNITGAAIATDMQTQIQNLGGAYAGVTVAFAGGKYVITSGTNGDRSQIRITAGTVNGTHDDGAAALSLTAASGAVATAGSSQFPAETDDVKTAQAEVYDTDGRKTTVYLRFFKTSASGAGGTDTTNWACDMSLNPLFDQASGFDASKDFAVAPVNLAAATQNAPAAVTLGGNGTTTNQIVRVYNLQFDKNGVIAGQTPSAQSWLAQVQLTVDRNTGASSGTGIERGAANASTDITAMTLPDFRIAVDGDATAHNIVLNPAGLNSGANIATAMQTGIQALGGAYASVTVAYDAATGRYTVTSGTTSSNSQVRITAGTTHDCTAVLGLGSYGAIDIDGATLPVQTTQESDAANIVATLDFTKLTQYAGSSSARCASQDGYAAGSMVKYSVGTDGTISSVYDNGQTKSIARVAVATFENPSGLQQVGGTMWQTSVNSGEADTGEPGVDGRGEIAPNALEMSNVDLSEEFTDMIVTERGFQANSRIITTSDEMLQELVNLKR